jgi:hypothetical protein
MLKLREADLILGTRRAIDILPPYLGMFEIALFFENVHRHPYRVVERLIGHSLDHFRYGSLI